MRRAATVRGAARTILRAAAVLALVMGLAPAGRAADVQVEATVDRNSVPIDEQIVYTVTISGGLRQAPAPELPALENDWNVSPAGTSRSFSFVNGQMSSSASYRFVLTPRRIGTFVIGKAHVRIGSDVYETGPITVTVTGSQGGGGGGGAPAPQPGGRGAAPGVESVARGNKDLFITTSVDNRSPYVQEQVILTFRFYQRINLLENANYTPPEATGFWSEDLPPQRNYNEIVNGQRYYVTEMRTALFPTAPGALRIGPARLVCVVPSVRRELSDDPFSLFGQSMFDRKQMALQSDPITLNVKALPPGAPPGFAGAVGRFDLNARLDKPGTPQGEPVTLTVEVNGTGNIKSVPDPTFPALDEFKVYDSSSSSDVTKDGGTVRGKKTLQQILVPLKAGNLSIPPISLVYFDPGAGQYRTARTEPLAVNVSPSGGGGSAAASQNRGAIEVVGQDIRFIRSDLSGVRSRGRRLWDGPLFWLFQILPLGVMAGSLVYERRRRRLEQDLGFARELRSGREASRRLKRARELARSGDAALHAEVAAAVRGYVADKSNRASAGLTLDEIRAILSERGMDAALIGRVTGFLEGCDMARFAPSAAAAGDRARVLAEAQALLAALRKAGL